MVGSRSMSESMRKAAVEGSGTTVMTRLSMASWVGWFEGSNPCRSNWVKGVLLVNVRVPHCVEGKTGVDTLPTELVSCRWSGENKAKST
jgi:hypothetical protein